MNKYVISSALLAASSLASAQSSVTMFGVVDTAIGIGSGSLSDRKQLLSGGNSSSRLGFRGIEDLGGGMSASFWLEAAVNTDDGRGGATNTNNQSTGAGSALAGGQGLTFARRSTVSLHGRWGEMRAGRDHAAHYRNRLESDPFGSVGVGAIQPQVGNLGGVTATRISNFVGYYLPAKLGGFHGFAQYFLGENPSGAANSDDGSGATVRLGYRAGGLNVSVATGKTRYAQTATTGDIRQSNLAMQYKFGAATFMTGYYYDEVESTVGVTGKGATIGGTWDVGPGVIKAAVSNYKRDSGTRPETRKLSLGYVHNLSKRTALYATYARVRNSGGATTALNGSTTAANQPSSGMDLGLRHSF